MATEVIIPALGVVVETVKILKWLKSEGDRVKEGEPLLEVESEKVTTEITAPASGIVGCILYPEGAEVPVAQVGLIEPGIALLGQDTGQPFAVQIHPAIVGPV